MASNRDTSNGPDWRDVAAAFLHLEEVGGRPISITAELWKKGNLSSIVWTARVLDRDPETGEVSASASASVSMLTRGAGGTDAALLLLAYELDRDMYRQSEDLGPKTA